MREKEWNTVDGREGREGRGARGEGKKVGEVDVWGGKGVGC